MQRRKLAKLILVGCVKTKRGTRCAAKDLYDSPLWLSRRQYAERSNVPWYVLSAKHGLLAPETVIAPYDVTLKDRPVAYRRAWSQRVLEELAAIGPDLRGVTVEIHAGRAYASYGMEDGLRNAGAKVCRPLAGIRRIGSQLAWYAREFEHP